MVKLIYYNVLKKKPTFKCHHQRFKIAHVVKKRTMTKVCEPTLKLQHKVCYAMVALQPYGM